MGLKKNKRKNPGVGVDFKRVKSKVGRKLKKLREAPKESMHIAPLRLPHALPS